MSNYIEVGMKFKDLDPRMDRTVEVIEINGTKATVRNLQTSKKTKIGIGLLRETKGARGWRLVANESSE